ncbi:MAG: thiamine pyrophosphate-dependent dehydrogenase E1 component subunit alpha [Candidatus Eisenbacteria bacterium]|nr:thiamine pyrophosphate-dependent dehydrogenase E1 component subunit alpha [Candidatus Eisenbacteria bacterium]
MAAPASSSSSGRTLATYDRPFLERIAALLALNRAFDDRVTALYRRGLIPGGAYGSRGQEATSVGSTLALEPGDVIGPMIRNSGAILARGVPPGPFLANFLGRVGGMTRGRDGNTHFADLSRGILGPISMLGALVSACAGVALAFRMRGEKRVALTWIGDGGSSTGDFHEGLNFAAVLDLPLVVIVENNGYAYSTPVERQCRVASFADKAAGYGIPGTSVDGNDPLAVYEATREAVARAREGGGPSLIEAVTFRMRGHAEHDDAWYVPRELREAWEARDPLRLFRARLIEEGILDEAQYAAIEAQAEEQMREAEAFALASPEPDPADALRGLYAGEEDRP